MKRKLAFIILLCVIPWISIGAKDMPNSKVAEDMFTKVYNMVYGPQGSTLHYDVNIIGIFKTDGTIYYKGKKFQYQESRHSSWQDGITAYMVDERKKIVNIYDFDDDKKDSFLSKFKFDPKEYTFSYTTEGNYYLLTAKVKNAKFFGIKSLTAKVSKSNLYPVSLSIKLGFMRTTVKISNFKSGGIKDSQFVFPQKKYESYKFIDNRKKK